MTRYEEIRRAHVQDMMELVPEYVERLAWPRERIEAEREHRLRELVRVAKARSPWHAKRLAPIDADTVREVDLAAIPPMTKNDLMTHWDDIVTDRRLTLDLVNDHLNALVDDAYLLDEYHACASGGSTGQRGVFVYDRKAWSIAWVSGMRHWIRDELSAERPSGPSRQVFVGSDHPSHMGASLGATFADAGGQERLHLKIGQPLGEIVDALNRFQPTSLVGYPSALHLLAGEARQGRLRIAPRQVCVGAEPLLPEIRAAIREAWGIPARDIWGSSECGLAACSRGDDPRLLLCEDLGILEPVDREGRPVPVGIRSAKIFVTNLFNLSLPLIRYEITDEFTFLEDPDPLGSGHRMSAPVQGRMDDLFVYEGGIKVHPHVFRSKLSRHPGVLEYQVRQTPEGAEIAVRLAGPVPLTGLAGQIEQGLAAVGVPRPRVSITLVGRMARTVTGKLKRFVPLPPAAEAGRSV